MPCSIDVLVGIDVCETIAIPIRNVQLMYKLLGTFIFSKNHCKHEAP
jgi:hypothetical protein